MLVAVGESMPLLTGILLPHALCMKPIAIATLCLSVALFCLAQYLSPPAQELLLPDPTMSMLSFAITFNHFVCCWCYDCGPGSRSSSTFASYKAVTTHIGRSYICQHEGKGVRTVTTQYRPSGRAEDQEAGAVGAAGAWPVRPAAPAAAQGKMKLQFISYTILYVYIVCIYRLFWAIWTYDIVLYVRHRIIPMGLMNIVYDIVGNLQYRIRRRTYTTS